MNRLCTICARAGSKGVPGKAMLPIAGKPLSAHSLLQARASGLFTAIGVSSDDPHLLADGPEWGADEIVARPPEMATDTAAKVPAIRHALLEIEQRRQTCFDIVVDLDITSPLRLPADIIGAVALLESTGVGNVITGCRARHSPYFNLVERSENGTVHLSKPPSRPILRRQDAPEAFDLNASVYVWRRDVLVDTPGILLADTLLYEMPPERSLDIDSPLDLELVTHLLTKGSHR
jgi:CMP-N,N'-diacetyllegionaminic acid synthase